MTKTEILEKYLPSMDNVLLILHDFQNHNARNYLSQKDMAMIAAYLKTTFGTIYGIVSYYTMFSLEPRGRHIIRICRSPVCDLAAARDVFKALTDILKIEIGGTTSDGNFTLETTECLGQCDQGPAMAVGDAIYGNLNPEKIATIIRTYGQKRSRQGDKPT
jgi:NADH:ubiquinone oxidoreductase subunit E